MPRNNINNAMDHDDDDNDDDHDDIDNRDNDDEMLHTSPGSVSKFLVNWNLCTLDYFLYCSLDVSDILVIKLPT